MQIHDGNQQIIDRKSANYHPTRNDSRQRKDLHRRTNRKRASRGNVMLIGILFVAVLAWAFVSTAQWGLLLVNQCRYRAAIEAASLAAAVDLSRIVLNDPYFGFIGLNDAPPIGKATIAGDGEPLPVTGINTIMATARLDYIIAKQSGSEDLISQARNEVFEGRRASIALSDALKNSLEANNRFLYFDLNGERVDPYRDAITVFEQNLANHATLRDAHTTQFHLELGSVDHGAYTNTPLPEPEEFAEIPVQLQTSLPNIRMFDGKKRWCYPAFANLPVDDEVFELVGLAEQVSLVNGDLFRKFNGERPASIVRAIGAAEVQGLPSAPPIKFVATSCAVPNYTRDTAPSASLLISFPDGLPARLRTVRSLLTDRTMDKRNIAPFRATGGDYPIDKSAMLKLDDEKEVSSARNEFSRGFLHWLRNAHTKPNVTAVLEFLDTPIKLAVNPLDGRYKSLMAIVQDDGAIYSSTLKGNPFFNQTIYDNQNHVLAFNSIVVDGKSWTVTARDMAARLGSINGGKHAGQPMPPSTNWLKLADNSWFNYAMCKTETGADAPFQKSDGNSLCAFTAGSTGSTTMGNTSRRGNTISDTIASEDTTRSALAQDSNRFTASNTTIPYRNSYLAGRLAFEFQIAGPKAVQ